MGFVNLSASTRSLRDNASTRLCMASILALVLVFTVAHFRGISSPIEKVDNGLIAKQHNSLRKLLMISNMGKVADDDYDGDVGVGKGINGGNGTVNRSGGGRDTCSSNNIALNQGPTAPLPSGIPTYTVIVENVCMSGCSISDVHFRCEWFSSARTINPHIFRRIQYDDCLFNDGNPLPAGDSLSFQYANTFPFPLAVSKLKCLS